MAFVAYWAKFYPSLPTVWILLPRGDATHSHTQTSSALLSYTCSYKPQNTHRHTHTRNRSWRAGWSPSCFFSKSLILTPQKDHRGIMTYLKNTALSFHCGKTQHSYAVCVLVDRVGTCANRKFVFWQNEDMGWWSDKRLKRKCKVSCNRGQGYIRLLLYKEARCGFFFSFLPLVLFLSVFAHVKECYPLVAGHPATARPERRSTKRRKKRAFKGWTEIFFFTAEVTFTPY